MAFPTSPSNNDVHKEGNRAWVYDSTAKVWNQVPQLTSDLDVNRSQANPNPNLDTDQRRPAGLEFIKHIRVTGGTTVEFHHGSGGVILDHTYTNYRFVFSSLGCSANDYANVCFQIGYRSEITGGDGWNTSDHYKSGLTDDTSEGHHNRSSNNFTHAPLGSVGISNAENERGYSGWMDLHRNTQDNGSYISWIFHGSYWQDNNYGVCSYGGGVNNNSTYKGAYLDKIRFFITQNYNSAAYGTMRNLQGGSVKMYGWRMAY